MQGILCCWPFCPDTVVMNDAKLISHIVTLSVALFATAVPVSLLLLRQYRVTPKLWKTWSMQAALVKLICNATYLTIAVVRSYSRGKISGHLIDTVRCFPFALAVIAEISDIWPLLSLELQKGISKLQYAVWSTLTITAVILLAVPVLCVLLPQLSSFSIRERPVFFPILLGIEIADYTFVLFLYFKYYRSIQEISQPRTRRALFPAMICCGFSALLGTAIMIRVLYSAADYLLWLDIFLLVLDLHFSARQGLGQAKVIHRHHIDNKNLKMHATFPSNYESRSSVNSRKSPVTGNSDRSDIERWPLPEVPRNESPQIAEHTSKEERLSISNTDFTDVEANSNPHDVSVLPPQDSLSSKDSLQSPDTLLDPSIRLLVIQSFKNGETVEGVIGILLAEYSSFQESNELTEAVRAIQDEILSSA